MRTIEFRGKNINGAWVFGSYEKPMKYGCHKIISHNHDGTYSYAYDVKPATVGQFTGLFDEDGREIYEGDIIKIVEEFDDENIYTRNGVVCFAEGIFELQDKNGKHFAYLGWMQNDDAITKLEVVGNIHDSPELLEKGGNQ